MTEEETRAYVQSSAVVMRLPLDATQCTRVAAHLQRTAAMADLLDAFPLSEEDELAEIYCPAPYPAQER